MKLFARAAALVAGIELVDSDGPARDEIKWLATGACPSAEMKLVNLTAVTSAAERKIIALDAPPC